MGFDGMVLGGVWVGRLRWERDEDRRPASRIYEGGRKEAPRRSHNRAEDGIGSVSGRDSRSTNLTCNLAPPLSYLINDRFTFLDDLDLITLLLASRPLLSSSLSL